MPSQTKTSFNIAGKTGEEIACNALINKGYIVIDKNVRYKFGEIDIVAKGKDGLHFVEVKARSKGAIADPFEFVTRSKIRKILRATKAYLTDPRKGFLRTGVPACHFDVISVFFGDGVVNVDCMFDAFGEDDAI